MQQSESSKSTSYSKRISWAALCAVDRLRPVNSQPCGIFGNPASQKSVTNGQMVHLFIAKTPAEEARLLCIRSSNGYILCSLELRKKR